MTPFASSSAPIQPAACRVLANARRRGGWIVKDGWLRVRFRLLALLIVAGTLAAGCAGPNPNPGERTTDLAWTKGSFDRAVEVARPRAQAGEPWAQLRMGIFFENGWGVERNLEQAEYWYRLAAAQKASGDWADGRLAGSAGKAGYFNQNSDARIAQFNLAQLYLNAGKNLPEAKRLVDEVIRESEGKAVFFCCEFAGGRVLTQAQFQDLKQKIVQRLASKQD